LYADTGGDHRLTQNLTLRQRGKKGQARAKAAICGERKCSGKYSKTEERIRKREKLPDNLSPVRKGCDTHRTRILLTTPSLWTGNSPAGVAELNERSVEDRKYYKQSSLCCGAIISQPEQQSE
jgi:hypothetical protein